MDVPFPRGEDARSCTVADVLLLLPLAQTYSYRIPEPLLPRIRRGSQVVCPVQGRLTHGIVLEIRPGEPTDPPLRDLASMVETRPPWPEDLLRLIAWTASYYVAPLGLVARTAMPSLFARRPPKPGQRVRFVRDPERPPRSEKVRALLEAMKAAGEMDLAAARRIVPDGAECLRRLLASGCLVLVADDSPCLPPAPAPRRPTFDAFPLTPHQASALERMIGESREGYRAFLLHGVTGSGKTEVYLRLIERALDAGKGAILLVPEIALTVELRRRFEERFGELGVILHSAMPEARRTAAWDDILAGRGRVVVGARSAIFAPVPDLGLLVVDEEHETSYKQEDGLRYNARDLALVRGTLARCLVVLGSATPSLETFQNCHEGKITYLSLPQRVAARPLPEVRFVDLRYEPSGEAEKLLSAPLVHALTETVGRGESAILFLNRRGFGRFLLCRTCQTPVKCPNCSITLTHHIRPDRLRCHYCDHSTPVPQRCPTCNSEELTVLGFGTERLEDEVIRLVPGARCGRLDSDTAPRGGLDRALRAFRSGETNVLVGTQIVAKGHDFPRVTLVGVLLAEQSLAFPDFRAAERTFQLLTQVAGRAGRGDRPGTVVIQTYCPDQYALRYASCHDFLGFAVTENRIRRERGYPPHTHIAAVEISSSDGPEAERFATEVRDYLEQFLTVEGARPGEVSILGPAAAAIERIKGRTRVQILLKGERRSPINRALWRLYRLVGSGRGRARIHIDVDPVNLL